MQRANPTFDTNCTAPRGASSDCGANEYDTNTTNGTLAGLELDDLVNEQERVAMRQDFLDLHDVEDRLRLLEGG